MNYDFDKILNILRSIKLSSEEKAQMRRNVLAFMEESPYSAKLADSEDGLTPERNADLVRHIRWTNFLQVIKRRKFAMPALIVALIIALSGGTAAAASTSLPGDALYPVKVNVSEKVASAFRFSDEGKAEFKLRLAERRLEEAEKLAVEGKLDANIVSNIETHFDSQEQRMQEIIKRLEANGKVEAATRLSSNLEAMLNAHDEIIAKLNAKIEAGEELVAPEVVARSYQLLNERGVTNMERVLAVRGLAGEDADGGFDEVSICSAGTIVAELYKDKIAVYRLTPDVFGIEPVLPEEVAPPEGMTKAEFSLRILQGQEHGGGFKMVCANAAVLLWLAGNVSHLREGYQQSQEILLSGAAWRKAEEVQDFVPKPLPVIPAHAGIHVGLPADN